MWSTEQWLRANQSRALFGSTECGAPVRARGLETEGRDDGGDGMMGGYEILRRTL